jgi:hypothetical protein
MMVLLGWPFVLQYLWLGLRTLAVEFKACWDYEPPVDQA